MDDLGVCQKQQKLLQMADLPKWPQMKVTGVSVTVDQAKEIIRRTDLFLDTILRGYSWNGNDIKYTKKVKNLLGISDPRECTDALLEKWGFMSTAYVHNDWLSSCFIWGPYGWCHPDGKIGFTDNVGKWPSAEEVFHEWAETAKAFPFLDIGVTLMSGESCEESIIPVISFSVKQGEVSVVDPQKMNVHAQHSAPEPYIIPDTIDTGSESGLYSHLHPDNSDGWGKAHAIPFSWVMEWAEAFKAA